jgi:hypothetical protein
MPPEFLPSSGTITLDQLAGAIRKAPKKLGIPTEVCLRVVAFYWEKNLHQYAAGLTVGDDNATADFIRASNGVLLIALKIRASAITDAEGLREFMQSWRRLVDPQSPQFGYGTSNLNISRLPRQIGIREYPQWQVHLYENTTMGQGSPPQGPVSNTSSKFFAHSVGAAATKWLRITGLGEISGPRVNVDVAIVDKRAFIKDAKVVDGRLSVRASVPKTLAFRCNVVFRNEGNSVSSDDADIVGGNATFRIPKGVSDYELFLTGADDFGYDQLRGFLSPAKRRQARSLAGALPSMSAIGGLAYLARSTARVAKKTRPRKAAAKPERKTQPSLNGFFVAPERLAQLAQLPADRFDLKRLIRMCEELNHAYGAECFFSVALLVRAVIDHVPPIFGLEKFGEVANNYSGGGESFKESMDHLNASARKIANRHIHGRIRPREGLPARTQVDFHRDLDVLLEEICRIL